MTVSATSPVASSTTSSASSSSASSSTAAVNKLSYNDFLTMLLAEMKNQDPTQPMDPTQMVSQLATISEVGQAVQTNTTLASLLSSSRLTQAEIAVGSTISGTDVDSGAATSGQITSVDVESSGATATLVNGKTVTLDDGVTVQ